MFTQSSQFGENWSHIRDTAKGISEDDGRELFHITKVEFQPPSKAKRKRIARAQNQPAFVLKKRKLPSPKIAEARLRDNQSRKTADAVVRILRPHFKKQDTSKPRERRQAYVFSAKHSDSVAPELGPKRQDAIRHNRRRQHLVELGKMTHTRFDVLKYALEIAELFGTHREYFNRVKA